MEGLQEKVIIQAKGKGAMQCWWVNQVASCSDLREKRKFEHDGEIGTAVDGDCGADGGRVVWQSMGSAVASGANVDGVDLMATTEYGEEQKISERRGIANFKPRISSP